MKNLLSLSLMTLFIFLISPGTELLEPLYYGVDYWPLAVDMDFDWDLWKTSTEESMTYQGYEVMSEGLVPDIKIAKDSTIKITGRKNISFEVSKKTYPNVTELADPLYQNAGGIDPEIKQQLQVKVEGIIKNRIFIDVDYDDTQQYENRERISVVYKGTEDEIVREVALGDITLSLPHTEFISFNRNLFGAKATLVMGPYSYYGLITKEEGVTQSNSWSAVNPMIQKTTYDINFSTSPVRLSLQQGIPGISLPLVEGEVYLYYDDGIFNEEDQGRIPCGEFYFEPLIPVTDYMVDHEKGEIIIKKSMATTGTVAMIYTDANAVTHGNPDPETFDYGALIYSKRSEVEYQEIRQLFLKRNIYFLGSSDLDASGLSLEILDLGGKSGVTVTAEDLSQKTYSYMHLFGIDRDNDGTADLTFLDFDSGALDFSFYQGGDVSLESLQPFNTLQFLSESEPSGITADLPLYLSEIRAEIGDVPFIELMQSLDNSGIYEEGSTALRKYSIYTEYYSSTPVFNLNQFNIISGSERVVVNGEILFRGRDYRIDYLTGTVEILNENVMSANASVQITYEYRPLMMSKSKTLVGNRVEYNPNENLSVGATYMDEWMPESNDVDIPHMGDETMRHRVYGANVKYDHIRDDYHINISAEAARSNVDPNTYGSVFIEDMESSQQVKSLPIAKGSWFIASPPDAVASENRFVPTFSVSDGSVFDSYNYFVNEYVPLTEINSNYGTGDNMVLRFRQMPEAGEFFSYGTVVSQNGMDLTQYRQIEIWYKANSGASGTVYLDLGYISEDADADGFLDTEDLNGNMELNAGEDIGWAFDLAGTVYPIGKDNNVLDTEDLNRNGVLNTNESVVRYSFDLGEGESHESNDWRVLTIPLSEGTDYETILKVVKHLRLWGEGFSSGTEFSLGRLAIVGTVWQEDQVYPEAGSLEISSISQYDDPNYINLHHKVDKDTGRVLKDVSLVMDFDMVPGVNDESYAFARKDLGSGRDFSLYNKLRVYFFPKETNGDYSFTVRLKTSQEDYFEKKRTVLAEDLGRWHYLEFDIAHIDRTDAESSIVGDPNINVINYIHIGVTGEDGPYNGVLYVNDIRLVDSSIQEGTAKTGSVQASYKNIAGMYYKYIDRDGQFAAIGQSPGYINSTNHLFRTNVDLASWLLSSSGVNLPVNFNYGQTLSETDSGVLSEVSYRTWGRTETRTMGVSAKFSKRQWPTLSYSFDSYQQDVENETRPLDQQRRSHNMGLSYVPPKAELLTVNWLPSSVNVSFKREKSHYLNLLEENQNSDYKRLTERWNFNMNWLPVQGWRTSFSLYQTEQWDEFEHLYTKNDRQSTLDNTYSRTFWILDLYGKYRAQFQENWSYEKAINAGNYNLRTFNLTSLYETRLTIHMIRYAGFLPFFQKKLDLVTSYQYDERDYYDMKEGEARNGVFLGLAGSLDVEGAPDLETDGERFSLAAKTEFITGISFDLGYEKNLSESYNKGNESKEESVTWPDAVLTVSRFQPIPLLKHFDRLVVSHTLKFQYKEKETTTYGYYSKIVSDETLFSEWRVTWSGALSTRCYFRKNVQNQATAMYERVNERVEGYVDFNYRIRNSKLLKGFLRKKESTVNTLLTLGGTFRYIDQSFTTGTDYYSWESSVRGRYDFGTGMSLGALLGFNLYRSEVPTKDYNEIKLGGDFEIRF